MNMETLASLQEQFEGLRSDVHNGKIEESMPKFAALYTAFIAIEEFTDAMKCFTQQMLGAYNLGEVTRAFQMLSEYEMLCNEYQVEKILSDYYPLLSVQYNILGEEEEAKRYMYEGSQYALEHENYTAYFSQRTLYIDLLMNQGFILEAYEELQQMVAYIPKLSMENAFILNIYSLQCQVAIALEDDLLFKEAFENGNRHPLVREHRAVRQVCNFYFNVTEYYCETNQLRRAYELIHLHLLLLEQTTMTSLERHTLEQYVAIAERAEEVSWLADAYKRLATVLKRELAENLNEELAKRKAIELREKAERDALTNCYNRHYLTKEVNALLREKQKIYMAVFDCDFFKSINDTYGHLMGDYVLKKIVENVQNQLQSPNFISRYGGDEFVLIMSNAEQCYEIFSSLSQLKIVEKEFIFSVSISMGVVESSHDETFEALFKRADNCVYEAKQQGRGKYIFK